MTINTVIKHHNAHSSRTMRGLNYLRQTEQKAKYTRAFRLMCPSFNLHTFDNWPGQQQLLLQHMYPPQHSPPPHGATNRWHFHCATICVAGKARRQIIYFVPLRAQQNKRERERQSTDDQSFPGNRMKMTMPGIRPGEREREREGASCKFNIEIKV